jgi:nucleotide-binding universal stress UspA family protein
MSFPYKRILCPVDFDDNSIWAVNEAGTLARSGKGEVRLLHVVRINPLATEGFVLGELQESQIKHARGKLEDIGKQALTGVEHEVNVEIGEPGDVILAMGKKLSADLVVMATHGRRGVARLILGSVAERVVRESIAPVLIVRPQPDRSGQIGSPAS